MCRKMVLFLILCLLPNAIQATQKKKPINRKAPSKTTTKQPENVPVAKVSPMIGTTVGILTRNGEKFSGELLDLSPFSLRIKSSNLESTISLETLAVISFDPSKNVESKSLPPISQDFLRESSIAFKALQTMEIETKSGSEYTEYGKQLTELRRSVDKFVQRYSSFDNATESRVVSLLCSAMIDYTWARTIWTLKLGGNGMVSEADNPVVADTLALYENLRTVTTIGDKFSADKLIGNLWKKASEKIAKARALANQ